MLSLYPQPEPHQLSRPMSLIPLGGFPCPSPLWSAITFQTLVLAVSLQAHCSQRTGLNQVSRLLRRLPTQAQKPQS